MTSLPQDRDSWRSPSRIEQLQGVAFFLATLWGVYLLDLILPGDWTRWGLQPRSLVGSIGIVTMPFLHASLGHILSNTIPLAILLSLLAATRTHSWILVVGIALLNGILLWILGQNAEHVGASGLVYGLAAFLIVAGFIERNIVSIIVSLSVIFVFGTSLFWGVLPIGNRGVSWDGHLLGAVAGGLVAWRLNQKQPQP